MFNPLILLAAKASGVIALRMMKLMPAAEARGTKPI
jgi:hypothetical protein